MSLDETYDVLKNRLLSDPSTSFTLRKRIEEDERRDPVDACADAEMLVRLHELRCNAVLNGS